MHKSQDSLEEELKAAATKVEVGASYSHYKDHTKTYNILGFGVWEPTDTISVIYQANYGINVTFVRPFEIFIESVDFNGNLMPRFKKLDP